MWIDWNDVKSLSFIVSLNPPFAGWNVDAPKDWDMLADSVLNPWKRCAGLPVDHYAVFSSHAHCQFVMVLRKGLTVGCALLIM